MPHSPYVLFTIHKLNMAVDDTMKFLSRPTQAVKGNARYIMWSLVQFMNCVTSLFFTHITQKSKSWFDGRKVRSFTRSRFLVPSSLAGFRYIHDHTNSLGGVKHLE